MLTVVTHKYMHIPHLGVVCYQPTFFKHSARIFLEMLANTIEIANGKQVECKFVINSLPPSSWWR